MMPQGAILDGKYRIDRVLGRGGMGMVLQATHLQLRLPVAIKMLLPEMVNDELVVQRFVREARAAVRLKNEHVARVLDVGVFDDGAPYIVLEYLEGKDLSTFSSEHLPPGALIDLVLQACEALAEAHALGIVHRDIKPANFFIAQRPDGGHLLKLLDFGISKVRQTSPEHHLTGSAVVMGTPAYMSPEQMKSTRDVDGRSDIWAIGVVLYELTQGSSPFVAENLGAMAIKVATEPPPPMATMLPSGLAEIILRCLAKTPSQRFQNVAELAQALAPYAQSAMQAQVSVERACGVLGLSPIASAAATTLQRSSTPVTQPHHPPPRASRRTAAVAAAIGALASLALLYLALAPPGSDSAAPAPPRRVTPAVPPPTRSTPPPAPPLRRSAAVPILVDAQPTGLGAPAGVAAAPPAKAGLPPIEGADASPGPSVNTPRAAPRSKPPTEPATKQPAAAASKPAAKEGGDVLETRY
jgi:eukaryotic-like serine/threonine-protein kinase